MSVLDDILLVHPCRFCGQKLLHLQHTLVKPGLTEPVIECLGCGQQGPQSDGATEWEAWQAWNTEPWLLKLFKALMKK